VATEFDVPSGRPAAIPTPAPGDPEAGHALAEPGHHEALERGRGGGRVRQGRHPGHRAVAGAGRRGRGGQGGQAGRGRRAAVVPPCAVAASERRRRRRAARRGGRHRRAVDEAAGLGTDTLVLVVGGLPSGSRDLAGARPAGRRPDRRAGPARRGGRRPARAGTAAPDVLRRPGGPQHAGPGVGAGGALAGVGGRRGRGCVPRLVGPPGAAGDRGGGRPDRVLPGVRLGAARCRRTHCWRAA